MLTIVPGRATFIASEFLEGRFVLLADGGDSEGGTFEDVLWQAGASVLLAHNAYQAELTAGCHDLSFAALDVELGANTIARIADCLDLRAIPYVLVSATPELCTGIYGPNDLVRAFARIGRPILH